MCAFTSHNLSTRGTDRSRWESKPRNRGAKDREKREPRRVGSPPLTFGEYVKQHPQGCFVCYGRNREHLHDHRTCPIHKRDTEEYKRKQKDRKDRNVNAVDRDAGVKELVAGLRDEIAKIWKGPQGSSPGSPPDPKGS